MFKIGAMSIALTRLIEEKEPTCEQILHKAAEVGLDGVEFYESDWGGAPGDLEEAASPVEQPSGEAGGEPEQRGEQDRRSQVDAFLEECNRVSDLPAEIIRKHIWRAAGHKRSRQFEYWQSNSDRATLEDNRNFGRLLSMSPLDFVELLKRKNLL